MDQAAGCLDVPARSRFLKLSSEVPGLTIRPARATDVPGIYDQIVIFANRGLMIRRSLVELYESIREFLVAVDHENRVIGCVALHVFWADLAEIRCLAVAEHVQGFGLGRRLIEGCWQSACELEIKSTFALTSAVGFFERCGFQQIHKADLPKRIWSECVRCPSYPNCTEAAIVRSIEPGASMLNHSRNGATAEIPMGLEPRR
jgi:amino-acid N-acetyltransferase